MAIKVHPVWAFFSCDDLEPFAKVCLGAVVPVPSLRELPLSLSGALRFSPILV